MRCVDHKLTPRCHSEADRVGRRIPGYTARACFMRKERVYSVYISTNHPRHTVLYTGVTNNIFERNYQHQTKLNKNSFTAKYNVNKVVYYETYMYIRTAIAREKEIKGWTRVKKIKLIESINPEWKDLVEESLK